MVKSASSREELHIRVARFLRWLEEAAADGSAPLAAIIFFVVEVFSIESAYAWWGLVGFGVLLLLVSVWLAWRRHRHLAELDTYRALAKKSYEAAESSMEKILHALADSMGKYSPNSRWSLYCHDPERGEFVMIARISLSPPLRKVGRGVYSDKQGAIGACWQNRTIVVTSLPEDPDLWVDEMCAGHDKSIEPLPREVLERISFRHRSALYARLDAGEESVGMVVVEDGRPRGVNSTFEDRLVGHELFKVLGQIVNLSQEAVIAHRRSS